MRFFNSLILIASIVAPSSVSAQRRCKDSNMPIMYDGDGDAKAASHAFTCQDIGEDIPYAVCEDPVIMSHCPMTCDQCDDYMCVDSEAKMKKGGRNRQGKTFYCSMLDGLDDDDMDFLCSIKKFQRSCRDSCGYCDYTMNFDNMNFKGGRPVKFLRAYHQTDLVVYNGVAANGEFYEYYYPELPFAEGTVSKPNFFGSMGSDSAFQCLFGKFDLKSLYIAPVWRFDYNYTSITFEGYGDDGLQGMMEVELETQDTVKFVEFSDEANFTDINYLYIYSYGSENYTSFIMDDIEVKVTSPCTPWQEYYESDDETDLGANHATVQKKISDMRTSNDYEIYG